MDYKPYMHIEKLGTSDVEGILNGTCYLTYKIDGTCSSVFLKDDGSLGFGSRNRELSMIQDNAGFVASMYEKDEQTNTLKLNGVGQDLLRLLKAHPYYIVYGEWLVPHTVKRYRNDAWKKLYIFDIQDIENHKYLNYDDYSKMIDEQYKNLNYIPLLAKVENPTVDEIKACLARTGEFLITQGLGEGIVIKNYDFVNKYGRSVWAKLLTEDFLQTKKDTRSKNKQIKLSDAAIENDIIKLETLEHISKEKIKVQELHNDDGWNFKYTYELLNRAFNEFIRDNWEIILKKFHYPTINFKLLKSLSDDKIKEFLDNM